MIYLLSLNIWQPDNDALFVKKSLGIGYSINFAHPLSWLLLLMIMGLGIWLGFKFKHKFRKREHQEDDTKEL